MFFVHNRYEPLTLTTSSIFLIKLLHEIASLKQQQMKLNEDIKEASSYKSNNASSSSRDNKSNATSNEKKKLQAVARNQEKEIELLKLEIQSLKSKCGHVSLESRIPCL